MSYVGLPDQGLAPGFYQELFPALPDWQSAPVPGWGKNPLRAGPPRVGVGAYAVPVNDAVLPRYTPISGDYDDDTATWGHVAGAAAAGILAGLAMGAVWFKR